jgi:hypothetical protein
MAFISRRMLAALGALPLLAACAQESAPPPRGTALPPPTAQRWEPAPMPSQAAEDFAARQGRALQASPVGPDAMPGFGSGPRVGTDMTTAPVPAVPLRQLR